jgi:hypothetical protein
MPDPRGIAITNPTDRHGRDHFRTASVHFGRVPPSTAVEAFSRARMLALLSAALADAAAAGDLEAARIASEAIARLLGGTAEPPPPAEPPANRRGRR